jgi:hypothetical protein
MKPHCSSRNTKKAPLQEQEREEAPLKPHYSSRTVTKVQKRDRPSGNTPFPCDPKALPNQVAYGVAAELILLPPLAAQAP